MKPIQGWRYICVHPNGTGWEHTVSWQRKDAIKKLQGDGKTTWKQCLKIGWSCKKVHLTIIEL